MKFVTVPIRIESIGARGGWRIDLNETKGRGEKKERGDEEEAATARQISFEASP